MSSSPRKPKKLAESKDPTLVDIIHEWLGQSGLRKIWGIEEVLYFSYMLLRENDRRYFRITRYSVTDQGDDKRSVTIYDPKFFEKLRKMLDERERTQTVVCRCKTCEGAQ